MLTQIFLCNGMFLQEIMDPDSILVEGDGLSKQYDAAALYGAQPHSISY